MIESKNLYLIDSGAYCGKKIIENYITNIGRSISEIKGIFLTHSHPAHIGTAAYFKEKQIVKYIRALAKGPGLKI